jgi:hypothetical protein
LSIYLPPHITLICTVAGLSKLECKTVQIGGSARGYQEFFAR